MDARLGTRKKNWTRPSVSGVFPSARCAHTTTAVGSKLYVYGGWNGTKMLGDLKVINMDDGKYVFVVVLLWLTRTRDPELPAWNQPVQGGIIKEAPAPRAGHTATLVGNNIWFFGGGDGGNYLNDVYIFVTGM